VIAIVFHSAIYKQVGLVNKYVTDDYITFQKFTFLAECCACLPIGRFVKLECVFSTLITVQIFADVFISLFGLVLLYIVFFSTTCSAHKTMNGD